MLYAVLLDWSLFVCDGIDMLCADVTELLLLFMMSGTFAWFKFYNRCHTYGVNFRARNGVAVIRSTRYHVNIRFLKYCGYQALSPRSCSLVAIIILEGHPGSLRVL